MSVRASKHDLVYQLFVRTADENYVAARWCAINRLSTDFLWLSVHCLEKYLKAVLLLNNRSARGYSHNISRLYAAVTTFANELLSDVLERPPTLNIYHWQNRRAHEFLEHLLSNGNADNRYAIFGYVTRSQDLHMLDQMVFMIRRLACVLDDRMFYNHDGDAPSVTNREILIQQPEFYHRLGMPLDTLIAAQEESPLRRAALNLNLPFAPLNFEHEPLTAGSSARNPVIVRRILEPLDSEDAEIAAEGLEIARWLLDNIQVPRDRTGNGVAEQIERAIEAARTRHGISPS